MLKYIALILRALYPKKSLKGLGMQKAKIYTAKLG